MRPGISHNATDTQGTDTRHQKTSLMLSKDPFSVQSSKVPTWRLIPITVAKLSGAHSCALVDPHTQVSSTVPPEVLTPGLQWTSSATISFHGPRTMTQLTERERERRVGVQCADVTPTPESPTQDVASMSCTLDVRGIGA